MRECRARTQTPANHTTCQTFQTVALFFAFFFCFVFLACVCSTKSDFQKLSFDFFCVQEEFCAAAVGRDTNTIHTHQTQTQTKSTTLLHTPCNRCSVVCTVYTYNNVVPEHTRRPVGGLPPASTTRYIPVPYYGTTLVCHACGRRGRSDGGLHSSRVYCTYTYDIRRIQLTRASPSSKIESPPRASSVVGGSRRPPAASVCVDVEATGTRAQASELNVNLSPACQPTTSLSLFSPVEKGVFEFSPPQSTTVGPQIIIH